MSGSFPDDEIVLSGTAEGLDELKQWASCLGTIAEQDVQSEIKSFSRLLNRVIQLAPSTSRRIRDAVFAVIPAIASSSSCPDALNTLWIFLSARNGPLASASCISSSSVSLELAFTMLECAAVALLRSPSSKPFPWSVGLTKSVASVILHPSTPLSRQQKLLSSPTSEIRTSDRSTRLLFSHLASCPSLFRFLVVVLRSEEPNESSLPMLSLLLQYSSSSTSKKTLIESSKAELLAILSAALVSPSGSPSNFTWASLSALLSSLTKEQVTEHLLPNLSRALKRSPEHSGRFLAHFVRHTSSEVDPCSLLGEHLAIPAMTLLKSSDALLQAAGQELVAAIFECGRDSNVLGSFATTSLIDLLKQGPRGLPNSEDRIAVARALEEVVTCRSSDSVIASLTASVFDTIKNLLKSESSAPAYYTIMHCALSWGKAFNAVPDFVMTELVACFKNSPTDSDDKRRALLAALIHFTASGFEILRTKLVETQQPALLVLLKACESKPVMRLDSLLAAGMLISCGVGDKVTTSEASSKLFSILLSGDTPAVCDIGLMKRWSLFDGTAIVDIVSTVVSSPPLLARFSPERDRGFYRAIVQLLGHHDTSLRRYACTKISPPVSSNLPLLATVLSFFIDFAAKCTSEQCTQLQADSAVSVASSSSSVVAADSPTFASASPLATSALSLLASLSTSSSQLQAPMLSTPLVCLSFILLHHAGLTDARRLSSLSAWKQFSPSASFSSFCAEHVEAIARYFLSTSALFHSDASISAASAHAFASLVSMTGSQGFRSFAAHLQAELSPSLLQSTFSTTELNIFSAPRGQVYVKVTDEAILESIKADEVAAAAASSSKKPGAAASRGGKQLDKLDADLRKEQAEKNKKKLEEDIAARRVELEQKRMREEDQIRARVESFVQRYVVLLSFIKQMATRCRGPSHDCMYYLMSSVTALLCNRISAISAAAASTLPTLFACTQPTLRQHSLLFSRGMCRLLSTDVNIAAANATSAAYLLAIPHVEEVDDDSLFAAEIVRRIRLCCMPRHLYPGSFSAIFPLLQHILALYTDPARRSAAYDNQTLQLALSVIDMHAPQDNLSERAVITEMLLGVLEHHPAIVRHASSCLLSTAPHLDASSIPALVKALSSARPHLRHSALDALYHFRGLDELADRQLAAAVASRLWLLRHDSISSENAALAEKTWKKMHHSLSAAEVAQHLVPLLAVDIEDLQQATALAIAEVARLNAEDYMPTILSRLFQLFEACAPVYISEVEIPGVPSQRSSTPSADPEWNCRVGIARALSFMSDLYAESQISQVFVFAINHGLSDEKEQVRAAFITAGSNIIKSRGREFLSLLLPIFEQSMQRANKQADDVVSSGLVVYLGSIVRHLDQSNPKVGDVVDRLVKALRTPSAAVQTSVCDCLGPVLPLVPEDRLQKICKSIQDALLTSPKYGERRGGAYGLAAIVSGLGIGMVRKLDLIKLLCTSAESKSEKVREGAMLGIELLCKRCSRVFEPYIPCVLPALLTCFGDTSVSVREAASDAARAVMGSLGPYGVRLVLPSLLKGLEDRQWRIKKGSVDLMGAMSYCAPRQLSSSLPLLVPRVVDTLNDTHEEVSSAAIHALERIGGVIANPEIAQHVAIVLRALADPSRQTEAALDALLFTRYVHSVDSPSLALVIPVLQRALRERAANTRIKAAQIVGSLSVLITEPKDMLPYVPQLQPQLQTLLSDTNPEVRTMTSRALAALVKGLGGLDRFPTLLSWVQQQLRTDSNPVARAGAAQGFAELCAAVGIHLLELMEEDIIRNTTHREAHIREGYTQILVFLPAAVGDPLKSYLPHLLPCVLSGLADETDQVRSAALHAGEAMVDTYAVSSLPLLQPPLEEGLAADFWRIRFSSIYLLGKLLSRVITAATGDNPEDRRIIGASALNEEGNVNAEDPYATDDEESGEEEVPSPQELPKHIDVSVAASLGEVKTSDKSLQKAARAAEEEEVRAAAAKRKEKNLARQEREQQLAKQLQAEEEGVALPSSSARPLASRAGTTVVDDLELMSRDVQVLVNALGQDACNRILAAVYILRADVQMSIRTEATAVWKRIVPNTPRLLRTVLPQLVQLLIHGLASSSVDRQASAARTLGDLVRKLGDRLLPGILPIIIKGMSSPDAESRQGCCNGLAEIIESAGQRHVMANLASFLTVITMGLSDVEENVRMAAGRSFDSLSDVAGSKGVREIVPSLLAKLEASTSVSDGEIGEAEQKQRQDDRDAALAALRQLVEVRPDSILPQLVPKLLQAPLTDARASVLASIAEVAGPSLNEFVVDAVPVLVETLASCNGKISSAVEKASAAIFSSLEPEDALALVITDLCKAMIASTSSVNIRLGSAALCGLFCRYCDEDCLGYDEAESIFTSLVQLLNDPLDSIQLASLASLDMIVKRLKKEELPQYIVAVREAIESITQDDSGQRIVATLPGFCQPKGLAPLLPMFLQGLMFGSNEVREDAALGFGEFVELTTPEALKPFVVQITGPLIRIVNDRFPWQVKSAILDALGMLLVKGGVMLKPFLPQLHTTFAKALADPSDEIKECAQRALESVNAHGGTLDAKLNELLISSRSS